MNLQIVCIRLCPGGTQCSFSPKLGTQSYDLSDKLWTVLKVQLQAMDSHVSSEKSFGHSFNCSMTILGHSPDASVPSIPRTLWKKKLLNKKEFIQNIHHVQFDHKEFSHKIHPDNS